MKVIKYGIVVVLFLFLVGCSAEQTQTEEASKASEKTEMNKEQELKEEPQINNDKIKDIDAVIKFVNDIDTNIMKDQKGEKLHILKDYEVHYFDFTGEGNDDVAIITWDDDNTYLPIIFVTTDIIENQYYLINSDFRGNEGDELFTEGNFIIKDDKKNQSYDIAYNDANAFIHMVTRYVAYGDVTQLLQPTIDIKYVIDNSLEKVDGSNQFNVHSTYTYFDEKGESHVYDDMTRGYTFNKEKKEYDIVETHNMESYSVEKLVGENFIVGNDDSLKTFDTIYQESDLKTAINYYMEHRTKFSKKARIQYVEDYQQFINRLIGIGYGGLAFKDEVITDGAITSVSISMDSLPEKVSSVFHVVKQFFVPDSSFPTEQIIADGYYTITCIQGDMTKKIRLMQYDKEVLITGEHAYRTNGETYVDTTFENSKQVVEDIKDLVYPTILINHLSQIDKVKYKDIWKANIVIMPEKINYY